MMDEREEFEMLLMLFCENHNIATPPVNTGIAVRGKRSFYPRTCVFTGAGISRSEVDSTIGRLAEGSVPELTVDELRMFTVGTGLVKRSVDTYPEFTGLCGGRLHLFSVGDSEVPAEEWFRSRVVDSMQVNRKCFSLIIPKDEKSYEYIKSIDDKKLIDLGNKTFSKTI